MSILVYIHVKKKVDPISKWFTFQDVIKCLMASSASNACSMVLRDCSLVRDWWKHNTTSIMLIFTNDDVVGATKNKKGKAHKNKLIKDRLIILKRNPLKQLLNTSCGISVKSFLQVQFNSIFNSVLFILRQITTIVISRHLNNMVQFKPIGIQFIIIII